MLKQIRHKKNEKRREKVQTKEKSAAIVREIDKRRRKGPHRTLQISAEATLKKTLKHDALTSALKKKKVTSKLS